MRLSAMLAGVILLIFVNEAHATKMSGKVTVEKTFIEALEKSEEEQSKGSKDYYWKLPNGIVPVSPPRVDFQSDIAVVLYRDDGESTPDDVRTVKVRTGGMKSKVIVTRPGSSLKFYNMSPYVHELYSPQLSSFKPEAQSKDGVRVVEFKQEGVFEVRCRRMPHFLAYVVVTPGKDIEVKGDGSFQEEIEPGKYTLKVFHLGAWVHKQSFTAEGGRMDPLSVKLTTRQSEVPKETTAKTDKPEK